jgi:MFS family permease
VLAPEFALDLPHDVQFAWIAAGGFVMTCTVGPVSAVVADVVHPGVRATGLAVLALFQNLLGLAAGPFLAGVVSDAWGLASALACIPAFGLCAAAFFLLAARSYESDASLVEQARLDAERAASIHPAAGGPGATRPA